MIGWGLLGCQENRESVRELKVYFDLDSLLDAQVRLLAMTNATLTKKVVMDSREEVREEHPDTTGWQEEFVILRDFDLNKSHYVGSYHREEAENVVKYVLNEDMDAPVKSLDLRLRNGRLQQIRSNYFEDKSIYQHRRNLELNFKGDYLESYSISGFQKMILKDTVKYSISGKVHVP